jgi:hypothetical protein
MAKADKNTKQPRKSVSPKTENGNVILGSAIFAASYLFFIFLFKWLDVWNSHFEKGGMIYVFYHFLRCVFLFYFIAIVFACGHLLLKFLLKKTDRSNLSSLDMFLLSSYLGAAVLTLVMFVLGLLKLNYTVTALIITIPAAFFAYSEFMQIFPSWRRNFSDFVSQHFKDKGDFNGIATFLIVFTIVIQIIYLFIVKGLLPDLITNDTVGHYLPYYQEVLNTHSIWMNKFFFHFYYSKGAGLFFLTGLLTDIQTIQIVSFYFLLMSVLTLVALVRKIANDNFIWMLVAVSVYLSSSMITLETGLIVAEFQKPHIMLGSFIVFMTYLSVSSFSIPESLNSLWFIFLFIVVSAIIVITPVSFIFIFPYLILLSVFLFVIKRRDLLKMTAFSIVSAGFIFMLIIVINYVFSGMAEATPLPWFFEHRNESALRSWISPNAILFQIQMNLQSGEGAGAILPSNIFDVSKLIENIWFVLYDKNMIPAPIFIMLLLAVVAILIAAVKKKIIPLNITYNIVPSIFMLVIIVILFTVIQQHSIYRYAFFLEYFRISLYMYIILFSITLIPAPVNIRKYLVTVVALIIFSFPVYQFFHSAAESQVEKYSFVSGKSSFAELYKRRWEVTSIGLQIQKLIGANNKIIVMNFLPGFYGIPKSNFQRPLMCDYNTDGDFETILFGSPEKAMGILKEKNINYALIILDRPFIFTVYAPLFAPENLQTYFKIAATGDNMLLLTWRSSKDALIDNQIISVYGKIRNANRISTYFQTYENMKKIIASQKS